MYFVSASGYFLSLKTLIIPTRIIIDSDAIVMDFACMEIEITSAKAPATIKNKPNIVVPFMNRWLYKILFEFSFYHFSHRIPWQFIHDKKYRW
jgi:hypothetical protein